MFDSKDDKTSQKRGAIKLDGATYRRIKLRQAAEYARTGGEPTMSEVMAAAMDALDAAGSSSPLRVSEQLTDVASIGASKKELIMLESFLGFVRSAPKGDVHMVLSLIARFSGENDNALNIPERRGAGR